MKVYCVFNFILHEGTHLMEVFSSEDGAKVYIINYLLENPELNNRDFYIEEREVLD